MPCLIPFPSYSLALTWISQVLIPLTCCRIPVASFPGFPLGMSGAGMSGACINPRNKARIPEGVMLLYNSFHTPALNYILLLTQHIVIHRLPPPLGFSLTCCEGHSGDVPGIISHSQALMPQLSLSPPPPTSACFTRLEELCSGLQTMRDRLETVWEEKGGRLDQILQLRVYENDSDQVGGST